MDKIPDIIILVGQNKDLNAVKECLKLKIPIISILDTNCNPNLTDFIIPANDDSVASVSLILNELSKAINEK
jgi:small subunit ribosomal protein S2